MKKDTKYKYFTVGWQAERNLEMFLLWVLRQFYRCSDPLLDLHSLDSCELKEKNILTLALLDIEGGLVALIDTIPERHSKN